jgi:F-type H+-transporting ATPase subunit gamma
MRNIRRRIRAVRSTQQITRAMKMVAAAKLRRAQTGVIAARPYTKKLAEVLGRLAAVEELQHPLLENRPVQRVAYVVVTGDRGLCGSYNINIARQALEAMQKEQDVEVSIVAVGRKGRDDVLRRNFQIMQEVLGLGEEIEFARAKRIADGLMRDFLGGRVDRVMFVSAHFVSALQQRVEVQQLLPVLPEVEEQVAPDYIFEPDVKAVVDVLIPKYVVNKVYHNLIEAKASEHGARMTSMEAATNNAVEMIDRLTLLFNRARQDAITKEISEVVGGAEALKG